jgi:N-methylhydantoinase A
MTYIHQGQPARARTFEVARVERFLVGSGLPVQVPVIEMIEIGAGGGSIAYQDHLGLLKVGPRSAGAAPGPACYGLGGTEPTVTDANLLLGYLSPDNFLAGRIALHPDLAEAALQRVAQPLGISVVEAAQGIFEIVNQNMVAATKVHAAERGQDPRRATLVAFGGAGPIHAHALARALGMTEVICPLRAGAASALGFLTAPIAFEFAQSLTARLSDLPAAVLAQTFAALEARGMETLTQAGIKPADMRLRRSLDLRHVGQGRHEVEVDLPAGEINAAYLARLPGLFFDAYCSLYGQAQTEVPIETVTCRLVASGPPSNVQLPRVENHSEGIRPEPRGYRPAYFAARQAFVDTALYSRYALRAGMVVEGPAIIEEHESTVVVPPEMRATVDPYGNLVLSTTR